MQPKIFLVLLCLFYHSFACSDGLWDIFVLIYNKTMRSRVSLLFLTVSLFAIFLFRGAVTQDPDFGWHIQAGNIILHHGVPATDPFSYSMPSYPFVDHEWLTNLLWSITFNSGGITPLLLMMSLLAAVSLLLQMVGNEKKWVFLVLFLTGGTLFDFVGVRTQVITWFFLSVILYILFQKQLWSKYRYFLPLLFLVWANLHGGFGVGIGVLVVVLLGRVLETKENLRETLLILGLCIAATFLNPYGPRLWWEFWMQLSDTQLRWSVTEWYPAIYFSNIAFWTYAMLSGFLIIKYRKHYMLTELVLYFFLLVGALSSMRNIPIWIIASFSLTVRGLGLLHQEASKYQYGSKRFGAAYIGFCIIAACLFLPQLGGFFYGVVVLKESQNPYPTSAVVYLHEHIPQHNIFSSYNWGGYLIWLFPEKKVFIDGRMPSWRWQANKPHESNYAFDDYKKVLTGQTSFVRFAQKFDINTLLVPQDELTPPETKIFGISIDKKSWFGSLFSTLRSFYQVVQEAKRDGWHIVYSDSTAVILQKPGTF